MPKQPKNTSKRSSSPSRTPRKQRDGRAAIVDQPALHRMGEVKIGPRRISRRIVMMSDDPPAPKKAKDTMSAMPRRQERPKLSRPERDQEAPPNDLPVAEGAGYLRLRFAVVGGEVTLKGARFVPGPFERPQELAAGLAFDARVGRRHVAAGNIPDPSEHRSFPDPAGRAGMETHNITHVEDFDFTVRVPSEAIDESRLSDLQIDVFRWRGKAPGDRLAPGEFQKQPKVAVQPVAEFAGIEPKVLPTKVRRQLEAAVRDLKR